MQSRSEVAKGRPITRSVIATLLCGARSIDVGRFRRHALAGEDVLPTRLLMVQLVRSQAAERQKRAVTFARSGEDQVVTHGNGNLRRQFSGHADENVEETVVRSPHELDGDRAALTEIQ